MIFIVDLNRDLNQIVWFKSYPPCRRVMGSNPALAAI